MTCFVQRKASGSGISFLSKSFKNHHTAGPLALFTLSRKKSTFWKRTTPSLKAKLLTAHTRVRNKCWLEAPEIFKYHLLQHKQGQAAYHTHPESMINLTELVSSSITRIKSTSKLLALNGNTGIPKVPSRAERPNKHCSRKLRPTSQALHHLFMYLLNTDGEPDPV